VRLAIPPGFLDEIARERLEAGCPACFHRLADGRCGNGWPLEGQELDLVAAVAAGAPPPSEVVFCREFELR
jgi:hypothetical protein